MSNGRVGGSWPGTVVDRYQWSVGGRVQLLTLFTLVPVNGRVGGSWPGTVVDIVHVGTGYSC